MNGITAAFRDADLLSQAIVEGGATSLRAYQTARDDSTLPRFEYLAAV